jgi:hypothetical protein
MSYRMTAGLLVAALGVGLLGLGAPGAHASSKGRKNTTLGLGGLAAYQLLKGKTTTGLAAGAGAAYAYKKYRDKRKQEKQRAALSVSSYSVAPQALGYPAGSRAWASQHRGRPVAWVDGRPIRTRDDYVDSRTGLRSADVPAPGSPPQRYDYGAAARAEAYRNSIYGQAEANQPCPPEQRRHR